MEEPERPSERAMRLSEASYQMQKLMTKPKHEKARRYGDLHNQSKRAPQAPNEAGEAADEAPVVLEIKKDVPMPTGKRDTSELYNTLLKMEVGDCLDLPFPRFQRSNVAQIAKRAGVKIVTRFMVQNDSSFGQIDTLRIWRAK